MSADAFWAAWLGERLAEPADEEVSTLLQAAAEGAETAYPGVALDRDVFFAHVAAGLPPSEQLQVALEKAHLEDLWIACAALIGSKPALRAFGNHFMPAIERAARRICSDATALDEVCQTLRERLLVSTCERPGDLSSYAGRCPLAAWLSVVAFREAGRQMRAGGAQPAEADFFVAAEAGANPELVAIKRQHADAFREAFEHAMSALTARDRTALRFHIVEGLSIDRIAELESIHRATAARWIARARTKVYEAVRAELTVRMNLSHGELESLIRVVRSQLDFSVRRHL